VECTPPPSSSHGFTHGPAVIVVWAGAVTAGALARAAEAAAGRPHPPLRRYLSLATPAATKSIACGVNHGSNFDFTISV